jgi:predicted AAA+ superfamily ATPase
MDYNAILKLRTLLIIIAESVPFKPNIKKLSEQVGISRETLVRYLYLLEKAEVLSLLQSSARGVSRLNKPEKIYLNNPNLMFTLSNQINKGTLRETFFFNQAKVKHTLSYTPSGDFLVDDNYTFEIGGKYKNIKQIAGLENGYIAADDIEYGNHHRIPLWLFGFLY